MKIKSIYKTCILFLIGGGVYTLIEIIWRSLRNSTPTHWSMFVLGGLCFIFVGAINEFLSWDTPLVLQGLIGTSFILFAEFVFGCILNLVLNLHIWDYSDIPLNICGQVCLPFAAAWFILAIIAIVLDDYLRYWLFKEEKPHYRWI